MVKFGGADPRFGPRIPVAVRQNMRKPKVLGSSWYEDRRRLTAEDARDVRERRRAGETLESIAQSYGVTSASISSLALGKTYQEIESPTVARSKPGRKRRFSDEQIADMRRRYGAGESPALIARDYGITDGFIYALAAQRTYRDVA